MRAGLTEHGPGVVRVQPPFESMKQEEARSVVQLRGGRSEADNLEEVAVWCVPPLDGGLGNGLAPRHPSPERSAMRIWEPPGGAIAASWHEVRCAGAG